MVKYIYRKVQSFRGIQFSKLAVLPLILALGLFMFLISSEYSLAGTSCDSPLGICIDGENLYHNSFKPKESSFSSSQDGLYAKLVEQDNNLVAVALPTMGTMAFIPSTYAATSDEVGELSYLQKYGFFGAANDGMVLAMYSLPTSNVSNHLAQEWIPGQQNSTSVYAAEDGFTHLMNSGIEPIWQQTRNVSYVMFVLVLIVIGFMIMFRQKIGGQVAVTVMNTIPNVIVSLLLITFSFALVGLIINLGGVLINVIAGVLNLGDSAVYLDGLGALFQHFFTGGGAGSEINVGAGALGTGIVANIVGNSGAVAGLSGIAAGAAAFLSGAIVITSVLVLLVVITVLGAVAYASVKVFFTLLAAYAGILLDTALAPIYLAVAAIPGQEKVRGDWLRRIIKNVLVFPIVFGIVNIGTYLLAQGITIVFPDALIGGSGYSGAGLSTDQGGIIGFVITRLLIIYLYFLAAKTPTLIADFFPQSGGKGVGEALKGAAQGIPLLGGLVK